MRFIISVFLLCMFLSPVSTSAQAVVSGAVTFSEDGVPAAGVRVTFFDLGDLHEVFSVITDSDGRFEMSPGAQDRPGLSSFRLMQNYPNPFNPSTVIPYELAKSASVRLEIFSVLGQRVRLLVDNVQPAGSYTENWDATDDQGQGVAAGVYLYALTVDGAMDTRRMVLLDGHKTSAGRGFPRSAEEGSSAVQQVGGTYGVTIYGPGTPISVHQPVVIGSGTGPLSFIVSRGGPQAVPKVQQQQANILGDVNNDGRVNISDALIVATYGLDSSISIPNGGDISLGDVNGDGRVNISDALIIATYGIDPSNASLPEGIGHAVAPGNQSPTLLNVALPGGATMDFVYIAPGTFTMGSPSSEQGRGSNEGPQHEVTISQGFYLGKVEVTQGQWEAVMGSKPSYYSGTKKPVEQVSWNDVQEFIQKLNDAAGESLYRLPTEAEWEYTCRAGTTTRWSFGDDENQLKDYAWYGGNNSPSGTKDVGTKKPNPWGLYDMHGNVWEWVQDWYGSYSIGAQTDPQGLSTGSSRVFRGGGFDNVAWYSRSALRFDVSPSDRFNDFGFRLLRRANTSITANHPPTATITSPASDSAFTAGTAITFRGTGTDPEDGTLTGSSLVWTSSRDGRIGSGTSVSTSGLSAGTHTITLTATDSKGDSHSATRTITVNPSSSGGGSSSTITATLTGNTTMDFVYIASGTFTMGSPSSEQGRGSNEGPQHEVTISQGFYLGKVEVTQGQWEAVMGSKPSYYSGTKKPVEQVSWNDVQEFIQKLNDAAGESLYRLPTEAEWEYACRAGTTTRWSFGDDENQLKDYAWYSGNNSPSGTKDVGTKKPNPWGLYDMHGNVWEWVQDWFGLYSSGAQTDPQGPSTGSGRVYRGDFYGYVRPARSAIREADSPSGRGNYLGFRLLRRAQ